MYIDPYSSYVREKSSNANVRFFHAIPNAGAVDVYLNNKRVVQNLNYEGFTQYVPIAPATYAVKLTPYNKPNETLLAKSIAIAPAIYTVAATGLYPKIDLKPIIEPPGPLMPNRFFLRFINLSPGSSPFNLTLASGKELFSDIPYDMATDYIPLTPGQYNFQIRDNRTNFLLLNVPNIYLKGNRFYSIYAIGLTKGAPALQVVIPLDGNSYLRF